MTTDHLGPQNKVFLEGCVSSARSNVTLQEQDFPPWKLRATCWEVLCKALFPLAP